MSLTHKKLKRKCYERDNYTCQLRIHPDCPGDMRRLYERWLKGTITRRKAMITVDHEPPLSKGGTWTIEGIKTACRLCNAMKGNGV